MSQQTNSDKKKIPPATVICMAAVCIALAAFLIPKQSQPVREQPVTHQDLSAISSGGMDTIGRYLYNDPPVMDSDPGSQYAHDSTKREMAQISATDQALMEELTDNYQAQTLEALRLRLAQQMDKSPTLSTAVATVTYAGMYEPLIELDGFYTSLYFTLQEYYQHSGIPQIEDVDYTFYYERYFGDPALTYDLDMLAFLHYSLQIVYDDESAITVGQRDQAITAMTSAVNLRLDQFPLEEWRKPVHDASFAPVIRDILADCSTEQIKFVFRDCYFFPSDGEELA